MTSSSKKCVIHILHVDDDFSILEITKRVLADVDDNFEFDSACCVNEALIKLNSGKYDVVISDYEMPQKDGLQFLKGLREKNNKIPFILFTGKGREEVAIKALNLGADAYVNKLGPPETVYGELEHALAKTIERKKALDLLYESEKKYRCLVENSLQGIAIVQGASPKFVFANSAFGKLFGLSSEEVLALSSEEIIKVVHPEDRETFLKRFGKRIQGEKIESSFEFRGIKKNGSTLWLEVCSKLIDYNGRPAVQAVFLDITERKQAEAALSRSELQYRLLANNTSDVIWAMDLEGHFTYISPSVFRLRGYTPEEVLRQSMVETLTPDSAKVVLAAFQGFWETGLYPSTYFELEQPCKDGSTVWTEVNFAIVHDKDGNPESIIGVSRDITERKKQICEIESLAKFPSENPNQVFRINQNGTILYSNPAGFSVLAVWNRKIGERAPEHISQVVTSVLISNEKIELEETFADKTFSFLFVPVTSEAYVNIYSNDITERKKIEERRKVLEKRVSDYSKHLKCMVDLRTAQLKDANERLVKSERLAAIGELAGMVGHDLRNPLAGIKNATYFLKKKGKSISEVQAKEMLETIDRAIDHSDKIINDLLEYSREMRLELTKYTAKSLLDESLGMISVPDRIQIVNNVPEEVQIWVNADKMMRVFINLINNAIDAMPENGKLEISSWQRKSFVEIVFADTGLGISDDVLSKLFSPLFTTKAQGMGFGLAICKRIVEAHEGTITVKTTVNRGTTFTISLPIKSD